MVESMSWVDVRGGLVWLGSRELCGACQEAGKKAHFTDSCRAQSRAMSSRARRPIRMTRLVVKRLVKSCKPTGTLIGAEWHDFT